MSRRNQEHGAAAVEFALVALLLVTLILGIIEFSYYFFQLGNVAGSAREAARVYAITGDEARAETAAIKAAGGVLVLGPGDVNVSGCVDVEGTEMVTVTVTHPYESIIGGFFFEELPLKGEGSMRCNG